MILVPIFREHNHVQILYDLLLEREPHQSISHKAMPTLEDHAKFVRNHPYLAWFLIQVDGEYVGAIYLTQLKEIGVGIFKRFQGKGYGKEAVKKIMSSYKGPFLANINPQNQASINLFQRLGFNLIQYTYKLNSDGKTN